MTNRISHVLPRSSTSQANASDENHQGPAQFRWLSSAAPSLEQHPGKFFVAAVVTGMVIAWWIKRR